ncbi:uncharacterized protein [Lepisosteus oculatus]|uniref:uncharacterized protein n=1 Tax=Lepisosteus oculatus TaxID=7918 RepID=UPI003722C862
MGGEYRALLFLLTGASFIITSLPDDSSSVYGSLELDVTTLNVLSVNTSDIQDEVHRGASSVNITRPYTVTFPSVSAQALESLLNVTVGLEVPGLGCAFVNISELQAAVSTLFHSLAVQTLSETANLPPALLIPMDDKYQATVQYNLSREEVDSPGAILKSLLLALSHKTLSTTKSPMTPTHTTVNNDTSVTTRATPTTTTRVTTSPTTHTTMDDESSASGEEEPLTSTTTRPTNYG